LLAHSPFAFALWAAPAAADKTVNVPLSAPTAHTVVSRDAKLNGKLDEKDVEIQKLKQRLVALGESFSIKNQIERRPS